MAPAPAGALAVIVTGRRTGVSGWLSNRLPGTVTRVSSGPKNKDSRYAALDALRGVAVLMVVYDHLFAVAGERFAGQAFFPVPAVRAHLTGPLGIIQDFGWLGVCLFFLISGFVILNAARRESMRVFVVRRFFRIVPPLVVAVAMVAALDVLAGTRRPFGDYLLGVSLAGYLLVPQVIVLGVAWTLVIEVIFYGLVALAIPLLRGRGVVFGVAAISLLVALICLVARNFGASFFLFAASVAYLPVLLMGSVIYLARQRLCPFWVAGLLFMSNWFVFAWAISSIHTAFLPLDNSYLLSLVYALAIFGLCINSKLPRVLHLTGHISYSLYLLHGTIGFAIVHSIAPYTGTAWWLPWLATVLVVVASAVMWRWVEQPSIDFGRRRLKPEPPAMSAQRATATAADSGLPTP